MYVCMKSHYGSYGKGVQETGVGHGQRKHRESEFNRRILNIYNGANVLISKGRSMCIKMYVCMYTCASGEVQAVQSTRVMTW